MGDIASQMEEWYDDYLYLCKQYGERPEPFVTDWTKRYFELRKQYKENSNET